MNPAAGRPDISVQHAFGKVLRRLRNERGISQEFLGHEIGSGRTYVSELERGAKGPSLNTVFRFGAYLGVSAAEIVRRVEVELAEAGGDKEDHRGRAGRVTSRSGDGGRPAAAP